MALIFKVFHFSGYHRVIMSSDEDEELAAMRKQRARHLGSAGATLVSGWVGCSKHGPQAFGAAHSLWVLHPMRAAFIFPSPNAAPAD